MKKCFSTVCCQDLNYKEIADIAAEAGINALEVRLHQGNRLFDLADDDVELAVSYLDEKNIKIVSLGTGVGLVDYDTEVIETAKLTTAKYIQHGIAKAHIEGKEDGYVLYYAVVRPNVNLEDITYEIDNENKKVTVIVPNEFAFDVELLEDEEHKRYCYPKEPDDWTDKDVRYICEADAKQKAKDNADLITKARESLINTIEALLAPVARSGYTVDVRVAQEV